MGQGLQLHGGGHTASFHRIGFHEFHPGGGIVEKVTDDDGGTLRASGFGLLYDLSRFQPETGTGNGPFGLGEQINAADGGDGGESLAPEAHGADGSKILRGTELGGGVAEKSGFGVLRGHAAAIVRDPEKGHAAVPDLHGYFVRSRVHGVFQKFLDNAGGTFHHLTGGDQVGYMGGKLLDNLHELTSFRRCPRR